MSLKNVHVTFIVAATLLAMFCAVQAIASFRLDGAPVMAGAGAAALGVAGLLVRYGAAFLRRCRTEGIR